MGSKFYKHSLGYSVQFIIIGKYGVIEKLWLRVL